MFQPENSGLPDEGLGPSFQVETLLSLQKKIWKMKKVVWTNLFRFIVLPRAFVMATNHALHKMPNTYF